VSDQTVRALAREMERAYKLRPGAVLSPTRGSPQAVEARRRAWWQRWKQTGATWTRLGKEFGRDRSTVRDGVLRVEAEVSGSGPHLRA
jgi:hypothetical protein